MTPLLGKWAPALAMTPGMVTLPLHVLPWWACLAIALSCPATYICRLVVMFRLGSKALEKANPEQVPAVMAAITGRSLCEQGGRALNQRLENKPVIKEAQL